MYMHLVSSYRTRIKRKQVNKETLPSLTTKCNIAECRSHVFRTRTHAPDHFCNKLCNFKKPFVSASLAISNNERATLKIFRYLKSITIEISNLDPVSSFSNKSFLLIYNLLETPFLLSAYLDVTYRS